MYICLHTCFYSDLKHIHDVMFPVMYKAEEGNITADSAKTFKASLYGEITVVNDLSMAGIVASGWCACVYVRTHM